MTSTELEKSLKSQYEFKSLAKNYANEALHVLAQVMSDEELPPTARVTAAKIIIERAHGTSTAEITETKESTEEQLQFTFTIDK